MPTPSHFGSGHFGGGLFAPRHFRPDDDDEAMVPGAPIPPRRFSQAATVELIGVEVHLSTATRLEVEAVNNPETEELAILLLALAEDGSL